MSAFEGIRQQARRPKGRRKGKRQMYKIISLRTGETVYARTKAEAEASVKVFVKFVNERIKLGITKEKRASKKDFTITEA